MTIDDIYRRGDYKKTAGYSGALSWDKIALDCREKKAILFGTGILANIAFYRLGSRFVLGGVVDNDKNKWGNALDNILDESYGYGCNLVVDSPEILKNYETDRIVVLIASVKYYEEIIQEIASYGISDYQVLLFSELKALEEGYDRYDVNARLKEYAVQATAYDICRGKIVCRSMGTYAGHAKYISEKLLGQIDQLDIVWIVDDLNEDSPEGIRLVQAGRWKQYIYEMETAQIWIADTPIAEFIIKRPGQSYINVKHWASVTLKKFYLNSVTLNANNEDRVRLWKYNSSMMDYILSGSDFDEESCRRGFDFRGQFIRVGSPRSDAMFDGLNNSEKIHSYYGLNEQTKILLYAPTYRFVDNTNGDFTHALFGVDIDFDRIIECLSERFGGGWRIMLRLHPSLSKHSEEIDFAQYMIDATEYPDGEELCSACDIMISDYSSIMFEPAFVKKPVFLYAPDRESYIDHEYDLLIDYDTLPFPIAETNKQLEDNIMNFDQRKYEADVTAFLDRYGVHEDGHASERAAEFVLKLLEK